jgi:hypothetical protein
VESLHQMVALSMLQQQSPSARMRGVTYSEKIAQPDPQVLDALLQAVNHDSNVNVRLSAVDALQKFASDPEVARAMVNSIPAQESPAGADRAHRHAGAVERARRRARPGENFHGHADG